LNAPSRKGGDEKWLLPEAALFVVEWRHEYKERRSLCVRHEVPSGMGTEVSKVIEKYIHFHEQRPKHPEQLHLL